MGQLFLFLYSLGISLYRNTFLKQGCTESMGTKKVYVDAHRVKGYWKKIKTDK